LLLEMRMTTISRSIHHIAEIVSRVFSKVGAIVIGFVLMALGLGMMVTVVMLPVGILLAVLGVLLFLRVHGRSLVNEPRDSANQAI
jgi:hypothetical protein